MISRASYGESVRSNLRSHISMSNCVAASTPSGLPLQKSGHGDLTTRNIEIGGSTANINDCAFCGFTE